MLVGRVGLGLGCVDGAVDMLGRPINRVKAQRLRPGVDDIVLGPRRNDDPVVCLDRIGHIVDPYFATARFEPEELIAVFMHLLADLLARPERHQDKLNVLPSIKNPAEIFVLFGQFLDIVGKPFHLEHLLASLQDTGAWRAGRACNRYASATLNALTCINAGRFAPVFNASYPPEPEQESPMSAPENTLQDSTLIDIPEAVGVFDTFEDLQKAFYDLRMVGIHHSDISLLGGEKALKEKLGKAYWHSSELEDDPRAPRAHFVSEEAIGELQGAIAGGFFFVGSAIAMTAMLTPASTLAASIAAVAIGGSPAAVIGTLLAHRVGQHHKDYYADQIEHGGILLWVRARDKERADMAVKIMKGHSGHDVHVHAWSK